jgi:SAM-dependent methyltransferase
MTDWASPPVDDVGYIPSAEMLTWPDHQLRAMIGEMRKVRYTGGRNYQGWWRDLLGLDTTQHKVILDYGCGVGMEALEYDESNYVMVCDIEPSNVELAMRVAEIFGQEGRMYGLPTTLPMEIPDGLLNVVHCSGVLHHIRLPRPVVEDFHRALRFDGELRLMLYSDIGWRIAVGTDPPDEVTTDPGFNQFVRYFDSVGDYADWYNQDRLEARFGDLFTVERCNYMTETQMFLGAVLRRRNTT